MIPLLLFLSVTIIMTVITLAVLLWVQRIHLSHFAVHSTTVEINDKRHIATTFFWYGIRAATIAFAVLATVVTLVCRMLV